MKEARRIAPMALLVIGMLCWIVPLQSQDQVDFSKIIGSWDLEVNADSEYYYLLLEMNLVDGKLEGGLSEQGGIFTDSPLSNILFDGENFNFEVTVPTPPDGAERVVKGEFKLVEGKLEGTLIVADLGAEAPTTGTKKDK
ncbi:MAG: hypothetical protein WCC06_04900 [Candidatus Aminicenantales bacterium]